MSAEVERQFKTTRRALLTRHRVPVAMPRDGRAQASAQQQKPSKHQSPSTAEERVIPKSYAQVESLVLPAVLPSSGGLKPGGITRRSRNGNTRSSPLTIRLSDAHRRIVRAKAAAAGIPVNRYVVASILGSTYRPPADPALVKVLLGLNRELTAQGNNLNQIARRCNAGFIGAEQVLCQLSGLTASMLQAHDAVRRALTEGRPRQP